MAFCGGDPELGIVIDNPVQRRLQIELYWDVCVDLVNLFEWIGRTATTVRGPKPGRSGHEGVRCAPKMVIKLVAKSWSGRKGIIHDWVNVICIHYPEESTKSMAGMQLLYIHIKKKLFSARANIYCTDWMYIGYTQECLALPKNQVDFSSNTYNTYSTQFGVVQLNIAVLPVGP